MVERFVEPGLEGWAPGKGGGVLSGEPIGPHSGNWNQSWRWIVIFVESHLGNVTIWIHWYFWEYGQIFWGLWFGTFVETAERIGFWGNWVCHNASLSFLNYEQPVLMLRDLMGSHVKLSENERERLGRLLNLWAEHEGFH